MSLDIRDLIGSYSLVSDLGADPSGTLPSGARINAALRTIAARGDPAVIWVPKGTYYVETPIVVPSNFTIIGQGRGSTFRLCDPTSADVFSLTDVSNIRIRDIRVDGNRANHSSSTGIGIKLVGVEDSWLENIQVTGCAGDGFQLVRCERLDMLGCMATDCGRHGFSLNLTDQCLFTACKATNCSRLAGSGVGDGFNLDVLSHDNQFIGCQGMDTSFTTGLMGYGWREEASSGCYSNVVIGGQFYGQSGTILNESDSLIITAQGIYGTRVTWGTIAQADDTCIIDFISTRQGLGIPALTTVQRGGIKTPRTGLLIYNSTTNKLNVYTGSAWEVVTST